MYVAVDFDGTVVKHVYPQVGEEIPNCVKTLQALCDAGHKLILFTMRSDQELKEAVQWFFDRGLLLSGINHNPEQSAWTSSPKVYAQLYIDDASIGCPLVEYRDCSRPYADWFEIERILSERGWFIKGREHEK